jgi:hypothetical protein
MILAAHFAFDIQVPSLPRVHALFYSRNDHYTLTML